MRYQDLLPRLHDGDQFFVVGKGVESSVVEIYEGPFSHAAGAVRLRGRDGVERAFVVEAVLPRVRLYPLGRWLNEYADQGALVYWAPLLDPRVDRGVFVRELLRRVGDGYDLGLVVREYSRLARFYRWLFGRPDPQESRGREYCSELQAECAELAGAALGARPAQLSPTAWAMERCLGGLEQVELDSPAEREAA